MTPNELRDRNLLWLMQGMEYLLEKTGKNRVDFESQIPEENTPSHSEQEKLIRLLELKGIAKIKKIYTTPYTVLDPKEGYKDRGGYFSASLEINQKKFQDLYKELKEKYEDQIKTSGKVIYISKKRGIWIDKDRKYGIKGKRLELVLFLTKNEGVRIGQLAKVAKQNEKLTIKEIKKINETFKEKLRVMNALIVREETSGYSLNVGDYQFELMPE